MKFFFTVLLIAIATATTASQLSLEEQAGAVVGFVNEMVSQVKSRNWEQDPDAGDHAHLAQTINDEAPASVEPEPSAPHQEAQTTSSDTSMPFQTVDIEEVPDFAQVAALTPNDAIDNTHATGLTRSESVRAEPLGREQVSEVIRRLGRVSRTAARSAVRRDAGTK